MLQRMLMRGTAFGLFRTYKGARILTDVNVTDELVQVAGMQGRGAVGRGCWRVSDRSKGEVPRCSNRMLTVRSGSIRRVASG